MKEYNLTGFSIDNFKVFGKETNFAIAPITILTGPNSSGKSSFIKALSLLNLSYKKNGLRKLSLIESKLKIRGFNSIINSSQQRKEVSFGLFFEPAEFTLPDMPTKLRIELVFKSNTIKTLKVYNKTDLLLEREFELVGKDLTITKSFIKLPESIIKTKALRDLFNGLPDSEFHDIQTAIINYLQNTVEAHTYKDDFELDAYDANNEDILEESYGRIIMGISNVGEVHSTKRTYFNPDTQEEESYVEDHIFSVNPQLKELLPTSILEITDNVIQDEPLIKYLDLKCLEERNNIVPQKVLENIFNRLLFIDGVRASQEMVYTQENAPDFFKILDDYRDLPPSSLYLIKKWIIDEFKLWKLPEGKDFLDVFKIKQTEGNGFELQILNDTTNIGLVGLGYGVTQVLPIILKVSLSIDTIFIIEEPESNLHPALQSKLADFFVESLYPKNTLGRENCFIIETHSEYLIRKLQYLTAKELIEPTHIQLYYFNHPDNIPNNEDQIKNININKDGSLTDNFGEGFFDEATTWKFELLKLNNSQKN